METNDGLVEVTVCMRRCKRGHLMDAANSKFYTHKLTGKTSTTCRACTVELSRLRYRANEAFREREKDRSRKNYKLKKAAKGEPVLRVRVVHTNKELRDD